MRSFENKNADKTKNKSTPTHPLLFNEDKYGILNNNSLWRIKTKRKAKNLSPSSSGR